VNGSHSSPEPVVACRQDALDQAQRQRHGQVLERLGRMVEAVRELPDGYALKLPQQQQSIGLAAEFIATERLCCPFINFNLEVAAYDGPLWLRLTGAPSVKDFLRAVLAGCAELNPLFAQLRGDSHE
jgi:hypothetical protein